jgi:hypothetical protein
MLYVTLLALSSDNHGFLVRYHKEGAMTALMALLLLFPKVRLTRHRKMSGNSLCVALLTHKVSGSLVLKWKVNKQF